MSIAWHSKLNELDLDKFIVSKDINSTGCKMFANIKMSQLALLLKSTPKDSRTYYERIHSEKRQKPFFDIDGTKSSDEKFNETAFLKMYLNSIASTLASKGIYEDYRLIVCSSSTDTKISYHVVVDGVYVPDIATNSKFCYHVINTFNKLYPKEDCLIDRAVYTKNRMFRLLYCHKYGNKDRMKRLISYTWNNKIYMYRCKTPQENILMTMVSHVSKDTIKKIEYSQSVETIDKEVLGAELSNYSIDELYSKYTEFAKENRMDIMELRDVEDNAVKLKRNKPSRCVVCKRNHSRENAYLIVRRGQLLYRCYRNNSEYAIVCNLDDDTRDDEDIFVDDLEE